MKVRDRMLETGVKLWADDPKKVTARCVAAQLEISHALVWYYFKTNEILQNAVAQYAVEMKKSAVIAALIIQNHSAAAGLSNAEKRKYLNSIVPKKS
jgi:AcrR family transcriptional regulator